VARVLAGGTGLCGMVMGRYNQRHYRAAWSTRLAIDEALARGNDIVMRLSNDQGASSIAAGPIVGSTDDSRPNRRHKQAMRDGVIVKIQR
jgi:hypothetical protein